MGSSDFSNLNYVAELRHIQSIHERAALRNPDTLVGHFLPALRRWRLAVINQRKLAKLRSDPFYYYLLARTWYYDEIFVEAISRSVQCIINIGCGSDTRSYRFENLLKQKCVRVLECDQLEAISARQKLAARRGPLEHISYLAIDLNQSAWPDLEYFLRTHKLQTTLLLMEGVSPYVDAGTFTRFLRFLARNLPRGSRLAYDYKLRGIDDSFGQGGKTLTPFRLPATFQEILRYHEELGYRLCHLELSAELTTRLLAGRLDDDVALFKEDGLIQLEVLGGQENRDSSG